MKLPLSVSKYPSAYHPIYVLVTDANHKVVCRLTPTVENERFCRALVRKMNRNWRWVLFGKQPYIYSREHWLFDDGKVTTF